MIMNHGNTNAWNNNNLRGRMILVDTPPIFSDHYRVWRLLTRFIGRHESPKRSCLSADGFRRQRARQHLVRSLLVPTQVRRMLESCLVEKNPKLRLRDM